jgi:hypothetical protein
MSTGLQRLRMAIVKLNKLQCMPENMSQLLSNKTHMPKNLYQTSSENSYSGGSTFCAVFEDVEHIEAPCVHTAVPAVPVAHEH